MLMLDARRRAKVPVWHNHQMPENITLERREHIVLIGLNRVAKRNAFDPAMFYELARAYGDYERDGQPTTGIRRRAPVCTSDSGDHQ
jgi:1,4-dihydroxy-2-naphthoyl-CoA synthase